MVKKTKLHIKHIRKKLKLKEEVKASYSNKPIEEIKIKNIDEQIILNKSDKKNLKNHPPISIELIISGSIGFIIGIFSFFSTKEFSTSGIIALTFFIISLLYIFLRKKLLLNSRIKKIESVFPDFIELMASNLRAGMTIDRALLLSSRKEFSPLDEEILILGKDIMTGKEITSALLKMSERIKSNKIKRTVSIIMSGIRSGGNLAILLEETAENMRERSFVEKRAASNVLMYVIFIFFAVAVGAPMLFSLSSILVEVLTSLLGNLPKLEVNTANLPFTLTSISISSTFITYFSVIFLFVIDILASLLLGLVNKGEEKEGFKYILPLVILSISIYFIIRKILLNYFSDFLS